MTLLVEPSCNGWKLKPQSRPTIWTTEAVATLARLWAQGYTARQIAEQIPGATRNAVISKANRCAMQRGGTVFVRLPPEPVIPVPEFKGIAAKPAEPGHCQDCGKTAQPGRTRCAECHTARIKITRPNKRAGMWTGLSKDVA